MKFWIGVLIVSPVWGWVSTQLFLQCWLNFIGIICGTLGLVRGRVSRMTTLIMIGTGLCSGILWSALMHGGFWLLADVLKFGYTRAENVMYWSVAAIFAFFSLPQVFESVRNSWRFAMVPGAIEEFSQQRRRDAALSALRRAVAKAA